MSFLVRDVVLIWWCENLRACVLRRRPSFSGPNYGFLREGRTTRWLLGCRTLALRAGGMSLLSGPVGSRGGRP